MKIAVLTNHFSGFDALKNLNFFDVPVNLIITNEKIESGRVISGAYNFEKLGLEIFKLKDYDMKSDVEDLIMMKLDVLIVMGYQRLVPKRIIDSVKIASFGFHGSSEFLPKGRGRSPINWELIKGKKKFILHLFSLEPGPDSGNVIDFFQFDINLFDNCRTVYYKVSLAMRKMLEKNIPLLLKNKVLKGVSQKGEPTFFPKRTPKDGEINWCSSSEDLYNFVRALTKPYPGAFTKEIIVWGGHPFSKNSNGKPGQVLEVFCYGEILVKTLDGSFLITDYEGTKPRVGFSFLK